MSTTLYNDLLAQAQKIYRHNRQGSYKTRERYYEAYKRFLHYLADVYHLEKIANVSGKHLSAYVAHMQEKGLSPSTIKTDLAAIRFWHDQLPCARYTLPGNEEFELERRSFGRVDRTWSDTELDKMLTLCNDTNHEDYAACMVLARYIGLRLHEVMRIDTAMARNALKTGLLTIKGKGGKLREVPVAPAVRAVLQACVDNTPPGHKLFVPQGEQTHIAKAKLQNFIQKHRRQTQADNRQTPLTFHGLRHSCAADWYKKLLTGGKTQQQAQLQVSQWLGHEREEITRIYLASLSHTGE